MLSGKFNWRVQILMLVLFQNADGQINLSDGACGSPGRSARIIGGSPTQPAEFPFMASIKRRGAHLCGAAVLNRKYVITAGHCLCNGGDRIMSPNQIIVSLGQYNLSSSGSANAAQRMDIAVREVLVHPGYKCPGSRDDLALLRLADTVWPSTHAVAPICLPDAESTRGEATVAGWGWLHEDTSTGKRADVLHKATVEVLENSMCNEWYASQGRKNIIRDEQLCAGKETGGVDACWADSGGPLFKRVNGAFTLLGVVSTGVGCGRPRLPGIYTRVTRYIDWIQEQCNR